MKTITIEDVEKKDINQATILDIRPEDAYCRGTVEGAINIPMQEVDNRRDEIPRDKPVYVLCHTGEWSAYTVNMLEEASSRTRTSCFATSRPVRWTITRPRIF